MILVLQCAGYITKKRLELTDLGPGTWDLGPGTWDPGPGTWDLGPGTWYLGTGTWDLGPGTWDLGPGTWDLGPGTWSKNNPNMVYGGLDFSKSGPKTSSDMFDGGLD